MLAEVSNIKKGIDDVNGRMAKFGQTTSRLGGVLKGALAGAAVGAAFKSVVSAASDAQQSVGATESVFGKFSSTVIKTSKAAATQYGLSANTYRENANLLGSLFKNQGVSMDQLAGKSKQFIGIGSDLAATFGGTTTSAVEALSSALKGEFDPLERYGISIKQSTINAALAAKGQDKLTGAALKQAQQVALTDLVMKQSKDSLGAFGRESNTLAHQQQVLGAKFQNIKATIGSALLPVLTKLAIIVSDKVLPKLSEFGALFQSQVLPRIKAVGSYIKANVLPVLTNLGSTIGGSVVSGIKTFVSFLVRFQAVIIPVAAGVLAMVAAYKVYSTTVAAVQAVQKAWIAVQAALNVVMSANPIGLLVLAIVGLAAAFIVAYKRSETFRNFVDGAFQKIKSVISSVMPVITAVVRVGFGLIKTYVTTYIRVIRTVITVAWNVIKAVTRVAWAIIKNAVVNPMRLIFTFVRGAVRNVQSAVSSAWNAVKSKTVAIWNGIKNAVTNAVGRLMNTVRSIRGKVTGAFSGAAGWLKSAGGNIIRGLIGGITGAARSVAQAAVRVVRGAIDAAKGALGIHSPSRVFAEIGTYTIAGLVKGLENNAGLRAVASAGAGLSGAVAGGFDAPTLSAAGAGGTGGGFTLRLSAEQVSQLQRGKEIALDLEAYRKAGGRK